MPILHSRGEKGTVLFMTQLGLMHVFLRDEY